MNGNMSEISLKRINDYEMVYPEMQISYPIRDKILVENTIPHKHSIPLGMQPIKYNVAYLRYAKYVENIFFYRDKIPNGIQNIHYELNAKIII